MTIVALLCIIVALAGYSFHLRKERTYWKDSAMANARARLTKNTAFTVEKQEINRRAGRAIAELNAQVDDLTSELKRTRNINRNLLQQLAGRREDDPDDGRV